MICKYITNAICRLATIVFCATLMFSCDNVNRDFDSVLNYPGAVVTKVSYEAGDDKSPTDCKYYIRLLRFSQYYDKYEYVDIRVTKYEFERYEVGDTVPYGIGQKTNDSL